MFCTQCGKEISDTTKFCPECGCNLAAEAAPDTGRTTPASNETHSGQPKKSPLILIVIFGVLLIILAIAGVAGYFFLGNKAQITAISQEPTTPVPSTELALQELYGIAPKNGKVRLKRNVMAEAWFAQTFDAGNEKTYVVFTTQAKVKQNGEIAEECHACSPSIGAITYKLKDGQWIVFAKQKNFTSTGSWGHPPSSENAEALQLGNVAALLIESSYSNQGYSTEGKLIFVLEKEGWRDLGLVQTGENNAGTCSDDPKEQKDGLSPCWSYSGKISVAKGGSGQYPDLIINYSGTHKDNNDKIVPVSATTLKFDGKTYTSEPVVSNAGPDWTAMFKSWENACTASPDFNKLVEQLIETDPKTNYRIGKIVLPEAYKSAVGQPSMKNQGEYTSFSLPITSGTYYGIPLASIEIIRGNENGIASDSLVFKVPKATAEKNIQQHKVKFKAVDNDMGGTIGAALFGDKTTSGISCDYSN